MKISLQTIFDKAWQHFIVNKAPLSHIGNRCYYHIVEDDRRCAIGCALTNQQARLADTIEDTSFGSLVKTFPEWFAEDILKLGYNELNGIQHRLHDRYIGQELLTKREYTQFAYDYNLEIPVGDN